MGDPLPSTSTNMERAVANVPREGWMFNSFIQARSSGTSVSYVGAPGGAGATLIRWRYERNVVSVGMIWGCLCWAAAWLKKEADPSDLMLASIFPLALAGHEISFNRGKLPARMSRNTFLALSPALIPSHKPLR